jgi:hypothetical protein
MLEPCCELWVPSLEACSLLVSTDDLVAPTDPTNDAATERTPALPPPTPSKSDAAAKEDANADAGDPDLVGRWSFEETSGTIARDSSGNQHDGILAQSARLAPGSGVADSGGLALPTPGAMVVDSLGGAAFPRSGTLSIWFRYEKNPPDLVQRRLFDVVDTKRAHLYAQHNAASDASDMTVAMQLGADAGLALGVVLNIVPGAWSHLVVTWDEATQVGAIYLDGSLRLRQAYSAPFVPSEQLFVVGDNFPGHIDEVALYRRAFGALEAAALR